MLVIECYEIDVRIILLMWVRAHLVIYNNPLRQNLVLSMKTIKSN